MEEHPSTPEHWITMIKVLVDGKEIVVGGAAAPVKRSGLSWTRHPKLKQSKIAFYMGRG